MEKTEEELKNKASSKNTSILAKPSAPEMESLSKSISEINSSLRVF